MASYILFDRVGGTMHALVLVVLLLSSLASVATAGLPFAAVFGLRMVLLASGSAGGLAWVIIPLDPLVWRKDLDPAVKTKLYTFLMSYGRIGLDDEIAAAKAILANLVWSTFQPSSDNQLIPIRVLEANKTLMRVQGDDKLSADEKSSQIAAIRSEIAKLEEMQKKAETDEFHRRAAAFLEADKAGRQDELKKMIAEFAAGTATTH